ncbi:NADH dehydrogenase [ubiquinone] 1 alpha subcomplex assembly factor 3 [Linepithema humile]|uniref:NADH dehydrogenase [ubiquinone] 1 alpha subcomplex assembly factor 3 n=1 Tax=Linepithema humile TaxID=83485 RepID=UPI0006238129|nr:PREDICTED: NADH dehydrogenase [ubiquinone] 1 alpha subcomplex assembly factor 3 [Linepithema humile]
MNVTGKLCQLRQALQNCRNLCTTHIAKNAYEAPGKTTVTFISKEIGQRLLVSNCDQLGFTLNTGNKVIGPTVLFPRYAICWNIASGKHINDASLSLFTILRPKPDLLIIGLDDKYDFAHLKYLRELVQKLDIMTEIVSVHTACTIFNFVNEEGRYVVAALIPQKGPTVRIKLPKSEPQKQVTSDTANSKADNAKNTK